jgi:hypothetical protein
VSKKFRVPSGSEFFFSEIGLYGYKKLSRIYADFRPGGIIQKKYTKKDNPEKLFF